MKKRVWIAMIAAAAMTAALSFGAMADGNKKVEVDGVSFEIPADLAELVTVETEGLSENMLVSVFETASVEAAKAQGNEGHGAGWIFGISKVTEERMETLRCGGMDGMEVFAEGDDCYLVYDHPTDVRFVREKYEGIEKDQEQWSKLNEWASTSVRKEILENNKDLEPVNYTNTELDMYLAKACFDPSVKFEVRSLEYGTMDPKALDNTDGVEDLAEDFLYEFVNDKEAPDGEYYVLAFPEGEKNEVRFDFFKAEEGANLIREVRTSDGEEYTSLYAATRKDKEDKDETTTAVMKEWLESLADTDVE